MTDQPTSSDLVDAVRQREWYHTIELAPGVVTPGWFDLREVALRLPWPDVAGARCLDVGTFDGFWAFEMERRGAGEVVAIDILDPRRWDWPSDTKQETLDAIGHRKGRGEGFEIARQALGSTVQRRELSVYDLDPADMGQFDVVYLGSILLHLRDPIRALERVRSVCRGTLMSVDTFDVPLSIAHPVQPVARLDGVGRPWWWQANRSAIRRMIEVAGFEVESEMRVLMPAGAGQPRPPLRLGAVRHAAGRTAMMTSWIGDPHLVTRAH